MTARNSTATPTAVAQEATRTGRRREADAIAEGRGNTGSVMASASCAGQTATHWRHPVHSADLIVMGLSTGSMEGQALGHLAQSMQDWGLRRMRCGLNRAASPSSAP